MQSESSSDASGNILLKSSIKSILYSRIFSCRICFCFSISGQQGAMAAPVNFIFFHNSSQSLHMIR